MISRVCFTAGIAIASLIDLAAQSPADEKPPIIFKALTLTGEVKGLYYDLDSKRIEIKGGPTGLSFPYTAPDNGSLALYRLQPPVPPATEPVRVPVTTVPVGDKGPYILLLSGPDLNNLNVRLLDNSWDNVPLLGSRVINASRRKSAVKVDANTAEIAPGEVHIFPPPAKPTDVIELKIATLDESRWTLRLLTPQALYPYTRNTFILKEQIPSLENPDPVDLDVFTIVDTSQPPAPKP